MAHGPNTRDTIVISNTFLPFLPFLSFVIPQALIVLESEASVSQAKEKFSLIDQQVVDHHVLKMIASKLLHIQEDTIQHFKDEGILYPIDAELLIEEAEQQKKILLRDFREKYFFTDSTKPDRNRAPTTVVLIFDLPFFLSVV